MGDHGFLSENDMFTTCLATIKHHSVGKNDDEPYPILRHPMFKQIQIMENMSGFAMAFSWASVNHNGAKPT